MNHRELENSKIIVTIEIKGLENWYMDFDDKESHKIYLSSIERDILSAIKQCAGIEKVKVVSSEFIN